MTDVLTGRIVTNQEIRHAVIRFFRMARDPRYIFREDKVHRAINFIALLTHFEGKHNGCKFHVEDWQAFALAGIFGFYFRDDQQHRVTTSVYIEIARKNGKTAFAAAICLLCLIADGEAGAEVYLAANSREQAKIAFKFIKGFCIKLDPKEQIIHRYRDSVTFAGIRGSLKVLAADSSKLDGPNPSMYLLDEYHAAKDTGMKDVLQSGQGMRENPLQIITTTAGFDKLSPCYEFRTTCTEILAGIKNDDRTFAMIYSLDPDDDWKDSRNWQKSNPNLGVTVRESYLASQVLEARNNPSEEVGIRTKNFNEWCDAAEVWIPEHYVLASVHDKRLIDFKGCDAWAGLDLSATSDLTSLALMVPTEEGVYYWLRYYLPETALKENRFRILYSEWHRQHALTITPGNVVDYDYILNDLKDLDKIVNIVGIGYDTWNATQFVINATDARMPMEPFSQSLGNFNRPTKEFERLILSGKAFIDNNIITRHCIRNVTMAKDHNGNTKPSKQHVEKKIDGVITMLEALGVWLNSPRFSPFI